MNNIFKEKYLKHKNSAAYSVEEIKRWAETGIGCSGYNDFKIVKINSLYKPDAKEYLICINLFSDERNITCNNIFTGKTPEKAFEDFIMHFVSNINKTDNYSYAA